MLVGVGVLLLMLLELIESFGKHCLLYSAFCPIEVIKKPISVYSNMKSAPSQLMITLKCCSDVSSFIVGW